jgi:putative transposase
MSEAFVKTFKRDYAYVGDISSKEAVMKQLPRWFEDYNEKAPHKALKMLSPREFIRNKKLAS